jgi:integrase
MGRFMIPNVEESRGRLYYRRRWRDKDGERVIQRIRLPALDDPSFAAALANAKAGNDVAARPDIIPNSVAALCHSFRDGLVTKRTKRGPLSARTIENYRKYADRIERDHGHRLVRQIKPMHVYKIQDAMADRPGVANNYLAILRLMLVQATKLGWVDRNAAAGVPALEIGEHEPWPARVVEAAIASALPMTRLAIVTYLCSGQRGGDVIKMQHGWHDRRIMQLRQGKTGKYAAVPMHPRWVAEIDAMPRRAMTILYDRFGHPFSEVEKIRDRINHTLSHPAVVAAHAEAVALGEIGEGVGLHPHGLRKNAACHLVELGLSREEAGSICGMTPEMVDHYTKRKQVYLIAQRLAERVTGATIIGLPGPRAQTRSK